MNRLSMPRRHPLRAVLPALAVLILPLALGACIGVEQEMGAPPAGVVEAPAADDASAAAVDDTTSDADEAPAEDASAAQENAGSEDAASADAGAATGISPVAPAKLNLNTASREDFLDVPNAGEKMAKEFDEYRPYATIGQFRAEIGKYVDEDQVAAYEEHLYVPVDPDTADAATMMQIPGMTESVAEALVAGQPYGDGEAFLAAAAGLAPELDLAVAAGYLAE